MPNRLLSLYLLSLLLSFLTNDVAFSTSDSSQANSFLTAGDGIEFSAEHWANHPSILNQCFALLSELEGESQSSRAQNPEFISEQTNKIFYAKAYFETLCNFTFCSNEYLSLAKSRGPPILLASLV